MWPQQKALSRDRKSRFSNQVRSSDLRETISLHLPGTSPPRPGSDQGPSGQGVGPPGRPAPSPPPLRPPRPRGRLRKNGWIQGGPDCGSSRGLDLSRVPPGISGGWGDRGRGRLLDAGNRGHPFTDQSVDPRGTGARRAAAFPPPGIPKRSLSPPIRTGPRNPGHLLPPRSWTHHGVSARTEGRGQALYPALLGVRASYSNLYGQKRLEESD